MAYYCKQLRSAYVSSSIRSMIDIFSPSERKKIYGMYDFNSWFEVVTNSKLGERGASSRLLALCLVALSVVERGVPTTAPKTSDGRINVAEINNVEAHFLSNVDTFKAQHFEMQKFIQKIIEHPCTSARQYSNYARYCLDENLGALLINN